MSQINFYNIDCMEFMRLKPDKCYDLAIVDPIYGIKEPAFRRTPKNKATKVTQYKNLSFKQTKTGAEYFKELFRISRNQIIWGGNYFIDHLYSTRSMIVWDKHTKDTQWADAELAWTSYGNSIKIIDFAWNGMIQGNMKIKEIRIHENQKPVYLYRWILQNYAKQDDKILDTHGGSMSNAIACDMEGFDLDICEIDSEYFKKGKERYDLYKQQLVLF
jgi:site-specific DNA-methyltransferase (adenine-specific)